jgi:hypothetical protein
MAAIEYYYYEAGFAILAVVALLVLLHNVTSHGENKIIKPRREDAPPNTDYSRNFGIKNKSPSVVLTLRLRNLQQSVTGQALREALLHRNVVGLSLTSAGNDLGFQAQQKDTVCLSEIGLDLRRQLAKEGDYISTGVKLHLSRHNQDVLLDDHFFGLTPLYCHEDWDIEYV